MSIIASAEPTASELWLQDLEIDIQKSLDEDGERSPRKYYNDRGESVLEAICETIPEDRIYDLAKAILDHDAEALGKILIRPAYDALTDFVANEYEL
jgi:hypothetical protein